MKYEFAPDLQEIAEEISRLLFPHVKIDSLRCFRSYGTSSRVTIARCHTIGKLMQKAMNTEAFYALEFLSERFDKLGEEEKIKVIIHELMHIPNTFGGGFRHHDHVCDENIENCYQSYKVKKKDLLKKDFFNLREMKWKNEDNLKEIKKIRENEKKNWFSI